MTNLSVNKRDSLNSKISTESPRDALSSILGRETVTMSARNATMSHFRLCRESEKEFHIATIEDFVRRFEGSRVINRVLIASNGIAALKFIRSARRWCKETFNNEKAIFFIVMATPEDLTANAEYIKLADQYVSVPAGGKLSNNYANNKLIEDISKRTKADAVWPGWNFSAETIKLPESLNNNGITFLGPRQRALSIFGNKISSLIMAQTLDIPTLAWSGVGLKTLLNHNKRFTVPSEMQLQACVASAEEGLSIASKIGFPVLIMASKACGGSAMRQVSSASDFILIFRQVQAEVENSSILVMKVIPNARHMELQVIGDKHGNVVSLFSRDCSIFRHYKKIVIEAPSTVAMPQTLVEMEKATIKLAKAAGYVGVGTAEFVYDPICGKFYFLEFIPQIQVEHPCTEMISQVNIFACLLQVAMGINLSKIKDIRHLHHENAWDATSIDFEKPAKKPKPRGHVIGVRITAEHPDDLLKISASGTVEELTFRSTKDVWGYFCFSALSDLMEQQYGHCFAWGETRNVARENLTLALRELSMRGAFKTSIDHLISLVEGNRFRQNSFDEGFFNAIIAEKEKEVESSSILQAVICTTILIADRQISEAFAHFQTKLERGQFPSLSFLSNVVEVELIHGGIKFKIEAVKMGNSSFILIMSKSFKEVEVHRSDDGIKVTIDGSSHTAHLKEDIESYEITMGNSSVTFEKDYDSSMLRSPANGKLVAWLVDEGSMLEKEQPYAEFECENEIILLTSLAKGTVSFKKQKNQVVEARSIIAMLQLEVPSDYVKPKDYDLKWVAEEHLPYAPENHIRLLTKYRTILEHCLDGFCLPVAYSETQLYKTVRKFIAYLKTPMLPIYEMNEAIESIQKRTTLPVEQAIKKLMKSYEDNIDSVLTIFPSHKIAFLIDEYASCITKREDRDEFYVTCQEIFQLVRRYRNGFRGYEKDVINGMLNKYFEVENNFKLGSYEKCLAQVRDRYRQDLKTATDLIFSHSQVGKKNLLVNLLLKELEKCDGITAELEETLKKITSLNDEDHSKVAHMARKIIVSAHKPSYDMRKNQLESILLPVGSKYGSDLSTESVRFLISSETLIFDVLHEFFYHRQPNICKIALEIYIRRVFMSYKILWLQHWSHPKHDSDKESFPSVHFELVFPKNHPDRAEQNEALNSKGCIAAIESIDHFYDAVDSMLETFDRNENAAQDQSEIPLAEASVESKEEVINMISMEPIYIIIIAIKNLGNLEDDQLKKLLDPRMIDRCDELLDRRVKRVSFIALKEAAFPKIFTYRARNNFTEDVLYRNIDPANAFQYEIHRLRNYELESILTENNKIYIFMGRGKTSDKKVQDYRLFIRTKVVHSDLVSQDASFEYLKREGEEILLEVIDEIELAAWHPNLSKCSCNHLFLNFLPCVMMSPKSLQESVTAMIQQYSNRLWKLKVLQIEMRFVLHPDEKSDKVAVRFCFSNVSGYFLDVAAYEESNDNGTMIFKSIGDGYGPLHGLPLTTPYETRNHMQQKRLSAYENKTTYCYDYPDLIYQNIEKLWWEYMNERKSEKVKLPEKFIIKCVELILDDETNLKEVQRVSGENRIGLVAWRMRLATPEFPEGREIVLIVSDLTFQDGSMGIDECLLFQRVSDLARLKKIPRIFISCNSEPRCEFAAEIKSMFKIAWTNPNETFKYLYLTPEDYSMVSSENIVQCTHLEDDGESRYKITSIIGRKDGIGIENLRYAAMIMSETFKAYDEIVTISMITSSKKSSSSLIHQLSHRVVQIGTGYQNGIAHKVEGNDSDGIYTILRWLSFMPKCRYGDLPLVTPCDAIDRKIEFEPTKEPYDPRLMLAGQYIDDKWASGFFDRDSWQEIMAEYAQSVVTGRARLGGLPVGVIAVETRPSKVLMSVNGKSVSVDREGHLLYPESSSKISHAIADFSREELPLFIFANWCGFSDDSENQGIELGADIVGALHDYSQPVFVYLPPHAGLRGTAWSVFDSLINPDQIEMYADPEAHASVLNSESTIVKKLEGEELDAIIYRLDPVIAELKEGNKSDSKIMARTQSLIPAYQMVAVHYASLHDTTNRLYEKGCINEIVPWHSSRKTFYWRLKRLMIEDHFIKQMCSFNSDLTISKAKLILQRWFVEDNGVELSHEYECNETFIKWLEEQKIDENSFMNRNIIDIQKHSIVAEIRNSLMEHPESVLDAIIDLCRDLSSDNLNEVTRLLTQITIESKERAISRDLQFEPQNSIETTESDTLITSEKSDSIKSIITI